MIVGTAGHIDHGKTALVRALTGIDTDRLPEERRRGISIELGFAPLTLDDGTVASIVDVPGHERFVGTMAAGASGVDAALLVIAATDGIRPQTEEHCAILRALGVPVVAIALTKVDRVADDEIARRTAHIRASLTCWGVSPAVPLLPVATLAGHGVAAVRAALTAAATNVAERDCDDLFRFVVDRVFTMRGVGTVVTGTVWSGSVAVGAHVRTLPDGREWRIRGVQSHHAAAEQAAAGARYALALADAAPQDIARGATLVTDSAWHASRRLVIKLDGASPTLPRQVSVFLGGATAFARWSASPADARVLRLVLDRPLVARRGDRLVLRAGAGAAAIVGATVADPFPERRSAVAASTATEQLIALARAAGAAGVQRAALPVRLGVAPRDVEAVIRAARLHDGGNLLFDGAVIEALAAHAASIVRDDADARPFAGGMRLEHLRSALGRSTVAIDAAISLALDDGRLVARDGRISTAGAVLSAAARSRLACAMAWVADGGLAGRSPDEAVERFGPSVEPVLRYAERNGNLLRLDGIRYCAVHVISAAVERLRGAMCSGREFTPGELRGVLGVSRRELIPLLEYCDAAGVTVRRSSGRVLAGVSSR